METQKKSLWQLFIRTFKIGALTWAGGYVIIPLLKTEFADKCRYIEESEIIDMVAVSQSLPGVISVNCCLMVGYRVRGARGALVAALGVILPSMITLSFVTYFYSMFRDNAYVAAALNGVRACVVGLMLDAVLRMQRQSVSGVVPWVVLGIAFVCSFQFNVNGILLILSAGLIGALWGVKMLKGKEAQHNG